MCDGDVSHSAQTRTAVSRFGIRKRIRAWTRSESDGSDRPKAPGFAVVFECPDGSSFTAHAKQGDSLLLTSGRGPQPISSACTDGTCGTCRVDVLQGSESLTEQGEHELQTKTEVGVPAEQRLGCHAGIHGDGVHVRIVNVLGEELIDP